MKKLKIALDWSANTNHSGFYIAQAEGLYKEHQIDLRISTPVEDNYQVTPAKKLELGQADLALCPLESILSYRTKKKSYDMRAIASILNQDTSAIAVLEQSNIHSPKDLDDQTYASYGARYEDAIVKKMIINDQGKGRIHLTYPQKLGIWETVLSRKVDATWIFLHWEGVLAESKKEKLRYFQLKDYQIPYSYSPVIAAGQDKILSDKSLLINFLKATKKGFQIAIENPQLAVDILRPHLSAFDREIPLLKSQLYVNPYYGKGEEWGKMKPENVDAFLEWLYQNNLEDRFHFDQIVSPLYKLV